MLRHELTAGLRRCGLLLALFSAMALMPISPTVAGLVSLDDPGSIKKYNEEKKSQLDFATLREKAWDGNAEAQFALGTRLSKGFNFDKDGKPITDDENIYSLMLAADQGDVRAQARLAQIEAEESRVKVNGPKAQAVKPEHDSPPTREGSVEVVPPRNIGLFDDILKANPSGGSVEVVPPRNIGLFDDILKANPSGGSAEVVPPESIALASGLTMLSVALGLICSYVLWTILGKSVEGVSPVKTGRRWMNWVAMLTCITPTIKYFSQMLGGYGNPANTLAQGVASTVVMAIVAFGAGVLWAHFGNRKSARSAVPATLVSTSPTVPDSVFPTERLKPASDNQFFAVALEEVETGNIDKGLWARLYAETDGDEAKTKARYIKLRAEQIGRPSNEATNSAPKSASPAEGDGAALHDDRRIAGLHDAAELDANATKTGFVA